MVPGDHVIINIYPGCGWCDRCRTGWPSTCTNVRQGYMPDGSTRLSRDGEAIHHMAFSSTFAEYVVVTESGAIKIRDDMPLDRACLIGCGVTTGYSAVFNIAKVQPGTSVLVVGAGGVGLNVIQSAALAAATTIIVVDIGETKLRKAREFGATHTIDASGGDCVEQVKALAGGLGVDYGFEAVSTPATIRRRSTRRGSGGWS